jgi:Cd2+/Zn2+-exporting ATPase
MLQPQKHATSRCGCASDKCAKPTLLRINKISETARSEPHPAKCCSDKAPLAASACCASDSCATPPSEHSPTSTDDGGGAADEESDPSRLDQQWSWKVSGMDCPACARTIETAVGKITGVNNVKVQFSTEKLLVNAATDISPQVQQAVTGAGFTLSPLNSKSASAQTTPEKAPSFLQEYAPLLALVALMALSWILSKFSPRLGEIAFIATTLVGLWPVLRQAIRSTRSGSPFTIETLMSVAALGALFIGATAEAAMVLLLFMIGERLEGFAANRARSGVKSLMALIPDSAMKVVEGAPVSVTVSELRPGDTIEVAAGGRLPADALLLDSAASFDESALTGESVPVERQPGEKIPAGSLCVDRVARLSVASAPGASAIDRILQLIEEADERRAPIERFLDTFSRSNG